MKTFRIINPSNPTISFDIAGHAIIIKEGLTLIIQESGFVVASLPNTVIVVITDSITS